MIVNIIGQPGSGKSTLAEELKKRIAEIHKEHTVIIIDGDIVRKVSNNFDYSNTARRINISFAYRIAESLENAGKIDQSFKPIILIALVSPYLDLREELKRNQQVIEVFLKSSRDVRVQNHVANYEKPVSNFIPIMEDCANFGYLY